MYNKKYAREALDLLEVYGSKIKIRVRGKNLEFKKIYNVTDELIIDVILSLKINNFVKRIDNKDKTIKTDYLYVFDTKMSLTDKYGVNVLVDVYIKICFIDYTLVVSFHEKEF